MGAREIQLRLKPTKKNKFRLDMNCDIQTFEKRLTTDEAINRTKRFTLRTYMYTSLRSILGFCEPPEDIYCVYYPNYFIYTTIKLDRIFKDKKEEKFIAGVDGITGRVGAVDVDLPDYQEFSINPTALIEAKINHEDAKQNWRDWLFGYLNQKYRPIKLPDKSLDGIDLVYTLYWVIDNGSVENSFAVNDLTNQVNKLEDMEILDNGT